MGYAVICAEEFPFLDITAGPDIANHFSALSRSIIQAAPRPFEASLCEIWDVPAADFIETMPVISTLPTLILAGTADNATPPAWSKLAGETLANSTYLEFPGLTHGLIGNNECLNSMTLAFLDNPTAVIDQSCLQEFPAVDYLPVAKLR